MALKKLLVLGATGYVGTRLVTSLLKQGYTVRASWLTLRKLERHSWVHHPKVETVAVDVFDRESFRNACKGSYGAYYLIHSMYHGKNFAQLDRKAAENMVWASENTELRRIIYLSGLGEEHAGLSKHLRSRYEVGRILRSGTVPVTILRAAMIMGAGSVSFEILRYMTERLPVTIIPGWLRTKSQPIAISNVLKYLVGCLENPETSDRTFDIGGPEILTYYELMRLYSQEAKLIKRLVVHVPFITPGLSSYWINLIAPIPASIAHPLIEGLKYDLICLNNDIKDMIPQRLLTNRETIQLALSQIDYQLLRTIVKRKDPEFIPEWTQPGDPKWASGSTYRDHRRVVIESPLEEVWNSVIKMEGEGGYCENLSLQHRGLIEKLIGGLGIKRSREDSSNLKLGDYVNCWNVVNVEPLKHLKLYAELKIPGRATLEFLLKRSDAQTTEVRQLTTFVPRGLFGLLYWYGILPIRGLAFKKALQKTVEDIGQEKESR
jgi:uncharacterized protein YbjT (DUF2867 family)